MIQSLDSEISRHEGQVTLSFTHFSKERCKFEQKCSMSKPHVITESLWNRINDGHFILSVSKRSVEGLNKPEN